MCSDESEAGSRTELPTDREALDGFELPVPNEWDDDEIETLVDRVLAALTECGYVAEYRSSNVWGAKLARYHPEGGDAAFVKWTFDDRLGWRPAPKSRDELRAELMRRLSRGTSRARNRSHGHAVDAPDEFVVAAELERD
jgi:hypothetical protein